MSDNTEALEIQSTNKEEFINPISSSFILPEELDRKLFLSADIKGKNLNLGIQLEEIYCTPYSDLVSRICEATGLNDSDADTYLNFVLHTIPRDRIM